MEQQRALNALEPYLALSKSATSARAAADLITQAISAPQTYVFAELLQSPNIRNLAQSPEYASYLRLLEIFAWGTLSDYNATANLPELTPAQSSKLLLLSLLPLCSSPQTADYTTLRTQLGLETDQAVEALVTTAIYENLVQGHLDPQQRVVRIVSVAPLRDLAPNSVPALLALLSDWDARCTSTLDSIEAQIAAIRARSRRNRALAAQREQRFEDTLSGKLDERKGEADDENNAIDIPGIGSIDPTLADAGQGTISSATNKLKGAASWFRAGKRAATTNLEVDSEDEADEDDDAMDLDDENQAGDAGAGAGGTGGGAARGSSATTLRAKKQGRRRDA